MKKLYLLSILIIVSCSPSEETIKKGIDNKYNEVKSIPASDPCGNLRGYSQLKALEEDKSTSYYSTITIGKINKYKPLCDAKLKRIEEEKQRAETERKRIEELNKVGNWDKGYYVDDFGDKTNSGFVSQTIQGLFSNSATEGSSLRVRIFINDGDLKFENPWFRFYEYNGNNPVKGTYSSNTMSCRIKDENDEIFRFEMKQFQGADSMFMNTNGKWNKRTIQRLEEIINEGGSAGFACVGDGYNTSTKYVFNFDFKYFQNIVRKLNDKS
jgi:hypothetical protein